MTEIIRARDLLRPGETALVLLVRGLDAEHNVEPRPDGSLLVGNWKATRKVDSVILYVREEKAATATVIKGTFGKYFPTKTNSGLRVVHVEAWHEVGVTSRPWSVFTSPGQNAMRYVTA